MICRLSHSPFSHGDLLLDDGTLLGSSNSPDVPVIQGNPCGVAIRPANYHKFAIKHQAVMRCSPETKARFHDFCYAQLGKPFDTGAVKFRTFLSADFSNRDWRDDSMWYCYEMLARATEVSQLIWWDLIGIKNRVTGSDYLMMINPIMDTNLFWETANGSSN